VSRDKILITGASGYIGSCIARDLNEQGNSVLGTARSCANVSNRDIEWLYTGDLQHFQNWANELDKCNVVIHCAGIAHRTASSEEYIQSNFKVTVDLAHAAVACNVEKFIFISSTAVYGEALERGVVSEKDSCNPITPYGESKLNAEISLQQIFASVPTKLVILRLPLVYGDQCPGNFRRIVGAINSGIPYPFATFSSNKSVLSVRNLTDALDVILRVVPDARKLSDEDLSTDGVYNLCDENCISIKEIATLIAKARSCNNKSFYFPPSLLRFACLLIGKSTEYETMSAQAVLCNDKFKESFDWHPPFDSVDEIINAAKSF